MTLGVTLWDLDNCLSDDGWRIPMIDWSATHPDDRYAKYHAHMAQDFAGNLATFVAYRVEGYTPVFVTARPFAFFLDTQRWLHENLGVSLSPGQLRMRPNGDHRPSADIKRQLVADIPPARVLCAFDDHPEVVRMYRELGMRAVQMAIHSLDAYNPPARKD